MVLCVCLLVQGEGPHLEIVLNTKETLPNFSGKCFGLGLLGDVSVIRWSRTKLGCDKVGVRALGFPVYYKASVLW